MSKKNRNRLNMVKPVRVMFLLFSVGFLIFLYLGLPNILAQVLENIFQNGTGCEVSLENPEISYINQTASIYNVSIICESEKGEQGEGFFAKKIVAGVEISKLLEKRILVSPLQITGAHTRSLSWESAFMKTLEFVLAKPEAKRTSWKAWVPEVIVESDPESTSVFEFGTKEASVIFDSVRFTSTDAVDRSETAVILEAVANNARFKISSSEIIELGNLDFLAQSKDGKVSFIKTDMPHSKSGIAHHIGGYILSKMDTMNLEVVTDFDSIEPTAIKIYQDEYLYKGKAKILSKVKGTFKNPEIEIEINGNSISSYGLKKNEEDISNNECGIFNINGQAHITKNKASINLLDITNVLKISKLELDYKNNYKIYHKEPVLFHLSGINKLLCKAYDSEYEKNQFVPVTVVGELDKLGKIEGELSYRGVSLEYLPYFSRIFKRGNHLSDMRVVARGTLDNPVIKGEVGVTSVGFDNSMPSKLTVNYLNNTLEISGTIFSPENTINILIPSKKKSESLNIIRANLKKLPIAFFTKSDIGSLLNTQVEADLHSSTEGFSKVDGVIKLYGIDLTPHFKEFRPPSPIVINAMQGSYQIPKQQFSFQELPVDVVGSLSAIGDLNFDIKIDGEIPPIISRIVRVEGLAGDLKSNIKITGTLDEPKLYGQMEVEDGLFSFKMGSSISSIDKINSLVTFDDKTIDIRKLEGSLGDGSLRLSGKIDSFLSSEERLGQIVIFGDNLLLEPIAGLSMYSDLNLALFYFAKQQPILKGDIVLNEAIYQKNFSIQAIIEGIRDFILGSTKKLSEKRTAQAVPLLLDIKARSSQGLLVDTPVLQAELDGNIQVSGDLDEPRIGGEVNVVDGAFEINQTKFAIMAGSMRFDGTSNINPYIQLSSEGDLRKRSGETEKIFLNISGNLNSTKVSFASDGASRPNEIVKQLGLGTGGSQIFLVDSNRKNVGFREVLSPSSDLSLSERFAGLTGFDQVRIETAISVRTGDFVPQVLASRPLPFDLRTTIWTELSGDRASGARVERRLRDNFSVFTGWRNQSAIDASSSTSGSNLSVGFRFKEAFKGFSFFENREKVLE